MPDWIGNSNSIFKGLGASNHTSETRADNDFYATSPVAAEWLLKLEDLAPSIWECACGAGHISKVLEAAGKSVLSSDLVDHGYGIPFMDFLKIKKIVDNQVVEWNGDIVTNPPYKYAKEFVEKAIDLIYDKGKVCMFLKIQFLESQGRKELFDKHPPRTVYVSRNRIPCAKNGDFDALDGSAVCYCWYVWEKNFHGDTVIKWFN